MSKRASRSLKVPSEFYDWVTDLSRQESIESGDAPSKARVMRLMTNQYKGKMVFKGKKIDFKIF